MSEYNAEVGASITPDKNKTIYKPFLKLKTPNEGRDLGKARMGSKAQTQLITVDGMLSHSLYWVFC